MATWSEKALAAVLGIETITGKGPTGKAGRAALRAGARAITAGTVKYAPVAARGATGFAAANPITAGAALGLGVLATPPGEALLESAAARGASDRVRLQQAIDEYVFRNTTLRERELQAALSSPVAQPALQQYVDERTSRGGAPRKPSKYNKAVKAGMAAVKGSKFSGKKGKINNAKAVFGKVNKTISRMKKGGKRPTSGVTGVIARAVRRYV